jgi:hypothetical protein
MNFGSLNYLAVLVAAISTFVLGGLWYSPLLFGKAWMRANNFNEADLQTFSKGDISRRTHYQRLLGNDCRGLNWPGLGSDGYRRHRRIRESIVELYPD